MKRTLSLLALLAVAVTARADKPTPEAIKTLDKPVSPDGVRAVCDLPAERHVRNTGGSDGPGGPGTGSGLCVFTSIQMAGDWQNVPALDGFQKWMMKKPGGGYPEKVDEMLAEFCREKRVDVPLYVQHTGGDESILDLAIKTGRAVGVTYAGVDGFYNTPVAHMVDLVHLDGSRACVVDNNRPGQFVWMTRKEFLNRWRGLYDDGTPMRVRVGRTVMAIGGGWAFILLDSPPPPYPAKPPVADMVPEVIPESVSHGVDVLKLKETPPGEQNFGLDVLKLRQGRAYFLNGREIPRSSAEAVLADDSDHWWVVAVGDADLHKNTRAAVAALPEGDRHKVFVQCYAPTAWAVKQFELPAGVSVRKPATGRVGAGAGHLTAPATTEVIRQAVILALHPETPPMPMPGGFALTEADLTADAKARFDAAFPGRRFVFELK